MADLALTGRVLEDLTIDELNQYLGQDPWLTRIISAYKNITVCFTWNTSTVMNACCIDKYQYEQITICCPEE